MESVDAVVVGAGVLGLAVARALALDGREVIIVEAEDRIGVHTSSRNSEVIHAGIYYPTGSLKARSCVAGRQRLYEYCSAHGVPHARCGKLIVATDASQMAGLEALHTKAQANGATDLTFFSRKQTQTLEPQLTCVAALHSPSTGIIDSHALMLAYLGDAEDRGAMLALRSPLEHARQLPGGGFELEIGGAEPMRLSTRCLVNCAGLTAPSLARRIEGYPEARAPREFYAKGNYYALQGRSPFARLVYPMPEPGGLGVHLTIDLGGQARFGPDVEWVEHITYDVDPRRAQRFYSAIRHYWPGLPENALTPGYAGIRPKIAGPGEPAADFVIEGPQESGVDSLINLFGIESPGLTASLSLADIVLAALH